LNTGLKFLLIGVNAVFSVDFTRLYQSNCQGYDEPGEFNSDYEYWTPHNFKNKKCINGAKIKYI